MAVFKAYFSINMEGILLDAAYGVKNEQTSRYFKVWYEYTASTATTYNEYTRTYQFSGSNISYSNGSSGMPASGIISGFSMSSNEIGTNYFYKQQNSGLEKVYEFKNISIQTSKLVDLINDGKSQTLLSTVLSGNDTIKGSDVYSDTLCGFAGNDLIIGGSGGDTMKGGKGDDTYLVDISDSVVEFSGQGFDTVKSRASYHLTSNVEKLVLLGANSIDGTGNGGRNVLVGNDSANTLIGKSGKDKFLGKKGKDILIGGGGNDVLTGGAGKDKFRLLSPKSGSDTITDFKAQTDKIQVVSKNFNKLKKGSLASKFFVSNRKGIAKDSNDFFVFKTRSKTLYFDKDGSGSKSAVAIAMIGNGVNLKHTDIVVV